MAKKKVAKSAKKQATQSGSNGSDGRPVIKWFSRTLPFLSENKGITIAQRQEKAIEDCKRVLSEHPKGKKWKYYDHEWEKPSSESGKFKLTVWIKWLNPDIPPGPTDPPIPAQRQPPPSM